MEQNLRTVLFAVVHQVLCGFNQHEPTFGLHNKLRRPQKRRPKGPLGFQVLLSVSLITQLSFEIQFFVVWKPWKCSLARWLSFVSKRHAIILTVPQLLILLISHAISLKELSRCAVVQTIQDELWVFAWSLPRIWPLKLTILIGLLQVAPDTCLPDGLCQNTGDSMYWRQGCTDKTWKSPLCLNLCTTKAVRPIQSPIRWSWLTVFH